MAGTKLKLGNRSNIYLYGTMVENLFINEFMPAAPGDYVKVFMYGLMCVQQQLTTSFEDMSRVLGLTETEIAAAWDYWSKLGVVRMRRNDSGETEIEFVRMVENLYGSKMRNTESEAQHTAEDERLKRYIDTSLRDIYGQYETATGRTISTHETQKLSDAINVYHVMPDVLAYAIKYCAEMEKFGVEYIVTRAMRWTEEGCKDVSQVKELLDKHSQRNYYYGLVFKEVGFNRMPSPPDREMMDRWFDEWGYDIKEVLEACRTTVGMREPSLKYVNKVLENRKLEAGGIDVRGTGSAPKQQSDTPAAPVSKIVLKEYYEYIRAESEKEQNARIDEVCEAVKELRDVFDYENELTAQLLSMDPMNGGRERREALRIQRKELAEEKRRLLVINGYGEDYLDRKYRCDRCRDTGITEDGRICECNAARAEEAYKWNLKRSRN